MYCSSCGGLWRNMLMVFMVVLCLWWWLACSWWLAVLLVVGGSSCFWWPAFDVMLVYGRGVGVIFSQVLYSMHWWWWLVYMHWWWLVYMLFLFLINCWPAQPVVWMVWTKQNVLQWWTNRFWEVYSSLGEEGGSFTGKSLESKGYI
uniref:Candidate secreted effector n=2 Tax=Meloidogyne incognita TaxID=6306 RepID=A0A914L754_MELIC